MILQRLQRLTAEAGEWARDYRARQRAAAANQPPAPPLTQPNTLRTVAETQSDAPVAALAAYTQSGSVLSTELGSCPLESGVPLYCNTATLV